MSAVEYLKTQLGITAEDCSIPIRSYNGGVKSVPLTVYAAQMEEQLEFMSDIVGPIDMDWLRSDVYGRMFRQVLQNS